MNRHLIIRQPSPGSRLRVLQVVPGIAPGYGGPSVALLDLVQALAARGVDTTLMTTNVAPGGKVETALDVPIDHKGARLLYYDVWPNTRYASSRSLAAALFSTAREYDLIHIHWLYNFSSLAAAAAARRSGVPYVLQPNGSLDPFLLRKNRALKRAYLRTAAAPMMKGAAGIIFTTDRERTLAPAASPAPAFIVPVGLNWRAYENLPSRGLFRGAHPELGSDPYILFLGRISRQKGLDLLVRAFQVVSGRHSSIRLVVAGPDSEDYQKVVEKNVARAGLSNRVHFVGRVPDALKLAAYVDSELFVLPSYAENFGAVVTEAMACGCAVVISDRVNLAEEVKRADAAEVIACDATELASAITRLLDDSGRRERLGARGRSIVKTDYTWDIAIDRLLDVYSQILRQDVRVKIAAAPEEAPVA